MLPISKCLQSWNVGEEEISVVLLSDGTKGVRWVWFDGWMRFEEHLELETAAHELEAYYKQANLAALIREYQAQWN